MFPLYCLLIVWIALMGIFAVISALSVMQMLRFGLTGAGTYISTSIFLAVSAVIIAGCLLYFLTIDWNIALNFSDLIRNSIQVPF